jgi:hypothetical protein
LMGNLCPICWHLRFNWYFLGAKFMQPNYHQYLLHLTINHIITYF